MIKLIVDPIVLKTLKQAMPKTKKAEQALEKYISILERHIDKSLMNARDNKFRFFKHFLLSTHDFALEVGQFRINGKRQYLTKWLQVNKLNLIDVVEKGLKGKDPSTVRKQEYIQNKNDFKSVALRWHKAWAVGKDEKHAAKVLRRLELNVFPEIGSIVPEKEINFIRETYVGNFKVAYSYLNNQLTILRIVYKGSPFGKI
jgi:hypothetical protein